LTPDVKNPPLGVYLTEEEKAFFDQLSDQLHVSRHSLLQLAMRRFIERYRAGLEKIEVEDTKGTVKKETD
jgi:hypothetical protein